MPVSVNLPRTSTYPLLFLLPGGITRLHGDDDPRDTGGISLAPEVEKSRYRLGNVDIQFDQMAVWPSSLMTSLAAALSPQ